MNLAPKRRWFRYSLRTLFVVALLCACGLTPLQSFRAVRGENADREEIKPLEVHEVMYRRLNQRSREIGRLDGFVRQRGLYKEFQEKTKSYKQQDEAEDEEGAGTPTQISDSPRRQLGQPPTRMERDFDQVTLIQRTNEPDRPAIDTTGFRDGAHHWRKIRDANRVIQPLPDQAAYSPLQVDQIAGNILLFQRDNGGWPKDYDLLAILTPEQTAAVQATRNRTDSSFDNHNIHSQVDYLARAYASDGVNAWRDACLRGFDFMLAAQLENGGFPQRFPDPPGYAAHITFNDGVMIGILNVLKDASDGMPRWKWLDARRRQKAQRAVARGIQCVLKCQIHAGGTRTGWCQQHDEKTYDAASARTFELASCCPQETTEIMRFLMRNEAPSEEIVTAVDAAAEWLRRATLTGTRVKKVPAPVEDFLRHTADFDVVVAEEAGAPPVWARHYEIGTDRPIFAGRDAVKRYALAEIERERRTGTPWYGDWPRSMLEKDYPNWRSKLVSLRR